MEDSLVSVAEKYHNFGLNILPLNYRDKNPALSSWQEWQTKPQEHDFIKKFFEGQQRNIGIICGSASNLVVLDFDTYDEATGEETFRKFFSKWEDLSKQTWIVRTPRQGIHAYFRVQGGFKSRKIPSLHIEVRGNGNYVAAPPSIHPNGGVYVFISSSEKIMEVPSEQFAQNLATRLNELGVVSEVKEVVGDDFGLKKQPLSASMEILVASGAKEGMRNDARYRIFLHAKRRGWSGPEILELLLKFNKNCQPQDSEDKVKAHFRQMSGQDTGVLPFFEGVPTSKIQRFLVMRGDEKNFYVFEFSNGSSIRLTDEQLMTPKPFIVSFLRTHGEIISIKMKDWLAFINFILKSPFAVVLEKEVLSAEGEFKDAVLDVLQGTPVVDKPDEWKPAFCLLEGDCLFYSNQQIKNIAQRHFSSDVPPQKLRSILSDLLARTTEQKMINRRRVRFWVFDKNKIFVDGKEMVKRESDGDES